jgi:hypothetical protein
MEILSKIREILRGKKSYLVGIASILMGLYIGGTEGKELIVMGLGFITLKAGQSNANDEQIEQMGGVENGS